MATCKPRFSKVKPSKEDIRSTYRKLSRFYDLWGFTESKALTREVQLSNIKDGESILEVAVGTGKVFELLASVNQSGRNEGIDLSPQMLEKARKRLTRRSTNYSLQVGDAYSLPYPDETFDLLVNSYMFDLLPEEDFNRVLAEFKRVLKSGGRMVVTTMACGRSWYSRTWDWLLRKNPHLLAGCRPISLEDNIKECNFNNIRVEYLSQFTFPSQIIYAEKHA